MNIRNKTKLITSGALMLALALALSFLESLIPPAPFMPPGVKIGLANIVIMFAVFYFDFKYAVMISVLKSFFVLITRGFTAFALSFCGGLVSVIIMILLYKYAKKFSYTFISICGSVSHATIQVVVATLILNNVYLIYYLPVVLISSIIMGVLTALVFKLTYIPLTKILRN